MENLSDVTQAEFMFTDELAADNVIVIHSQNHHTTYNLMSMANVVVTLTLPCTLQCFPNNLILNVVVADRGLKVF